jgi:chromosome segregation ATPase
MIVDLNKPMGWTEKNMSNGWMRRVKMPADSKVAKLKTENEDLKSTKDGSALNLWLQSQEQAKTLTEEIRAAQADKDKLEKMLQTARDKYDENREVVHQTGLTIKAIKSEIQTYTSKIAQEQEFIDNLSKNKGTRCTHCFGLVTEDNCTHAKERAKVEIQKYRQTIEAFNKKWGEQQAALDKKSLGVTTLKDALDQANRRHKEIAHQLTKLNDDYNLCVSVPRPEVDSTTLVLEKEIQSLTAQARQKKQEYDTSPFADILKTAIQERDTKIIKTQDKKAEVEKAQADLPYYDFWLKAFGDKGIRKFAIDGIIPALNNRMAYWMEVLFDGIIRIDFDNELNETIETVPPDGDAFVYFGMSGGEKRSLNLSVAHSFAYIMTLSSGASPSVIFLDEVSSNIDAVGIQYIYNMIVELAKEKQVFITTHDSHLVELLNGCDKLNLEKRGGFTKIK